MAWDNLRGTMTQGNTVYVAFDEAQKEVERAVKEEREACAKIAEAAPVYGNKQIAALIRGQKQPK